MYFHLISITVSLFVVTTQASYPNCTIKWSDPLPSFYPLVFNGSGIIYPRRTSNNSDWNIAIVKYSNVKVGCSADTTNVVKGSDGKNEIVMRCGRSGLRVGKQPANFSDLGCTKAVKEKLVVTGDCYNNFTSADILFQSNTTVLPLINICHDTNLDGTIFTHHFLIGAGLNTYEISNSRPSFKEGPFYTKISANEAYSQNAQKNQVAYLVGSQSLAEKYINTSRSYYFARGHYAPDGDFVHIYEQNATYYYANAAPQWQVINNGNWKGLESAIRNYAKSRNVDLEVWTGGKDVLKLPDVNNNLVDIYLSRDSTNKNRLPAPELLWKVLKDPVRNASVAVFMVNNPHLEVIPERLKVCRDVCSQIYWVTWDTQNIQKGFTYCCKVSNTKSALPYIPETLDNLDLMT